MGNKWNGIQIEMGKCKVCETYFANRLITNGKCKTCESVPVQEIAQQESTKENQNTDQTENNNQSTHTSI